MATNLFIPGGYNIISNQISLYHNGMLDLGGEPDLGLAGDYVSYGLYDSIYIHETYTRFFKYPFQPVGYVSTNGANYADKYTIVDFLPAYNIGGNRFDSVHIINHASFQGEYSDYFYINTSVGIIKISYNHDPYFAVLELQRYKIIH